MTSGAHLVTMGILPDLDFHSANCSLALSTEPASSRYIRCARAGSQRAEGATGGEFMQPGEPNAQRTAEAALPTTWPFLRINGTIVN